VVRCSHRSDAISPKPTSELFYVPLIRMPQWTSPRRPAKPLRIAPSAPIHVALVNQLARVIPADRTHLLQNSAGDLTGFHNGYDSGWF